MVAMLLVVVTAGAMSSGADVAQGGLAPAESRALSSVAARVRISDLRTEIAHHDELYYKKAEPEISDATYDQLKRELASLEKTYPAQATGASPSESLGDDRAGGFPVYRHRERMRSLDKSYSEAELRAFHARLVRQLGRQDLVFVVEPKFDGLAISVTYEKGKLVRAVTRGNGIEGDDVTANVRAMRGLPHELQQFPPSGEGANPIPDVIELRGEIYLPLAEFARLNRERESAGEAPIRQPAECGRWHAQAA